MYLLRSDAIRQLTGLAGFMEEEVAMFTPPTSEIYLLVLRTSRLHINADTGEVDALAINQDLGLVADVLLNVGAFEFYPELEQALGMVMWLAQEFHRFPVALLPPPEEMVA